MFHLRTERSPTEYCAQRPILRYFFIALGDEPVGVGAAQTPEFLIEAALQRGEELRALLGVGEILRLLDDFFR